MIVVFSGIRDVSVDSHADIEMAAIEEAATASELRFGAAVGSDSIALRAVCDVDDAEVRRVVVVPFGLLQQPREAVEIVRRCADEVVELRLPRHRASYLRRNDVLLDGADRVVAFTDGRRTGGTAYTIRKARAQGLDVVEIPVASQRMTGHPRVTVESSAPVYAWVEYRSVGEHGTAAQRKASQVVRDLKAGVWTKDADWVVERLASYIRRTPNLRSRKFIVAMPRRQPDVASDLEKLAEEVALLTDLEHLPGCLVRETEPKGGVVRRRRLRFSADQHAETLRAGRRVAGKDIVLLDNVITSLSGTMAGAQQAIERDTGSAPVGLAITYSGDVSAIRKGGHHGA